MCVSGNPTLLSLTALSTRSSLQVVTNRSGLKSVRKHFPNEAAWWTKHDVTPQNTQNRLLQNQLFATEHTEF